MANDYQFRDTSNTGGPQDARTAFFWRTLAFSLAALLVLTLATAAVGWARAWRPPTLESHVTKEGFTCYTYGGQFQCGPSWAAIPPWLYETFKEETSNRGK